MERANGPAAENGFFERTRRGVGVGTGIGIAQQLTQVTVHTTTFREKGSGSFYYSRGLESRQDVRKRSMKKTARTAGVQSVDVAVHKLEKRGYDAIRSFT